MSAENPLKEKPLSQTLAAEAPVHEQLGALRELGLRPTRISDALEVSSEALRLWTKGGSVRESNRRVIGDMAKVALLLLEGGDRKAAVQWMITPAKAGDPPPLKLIRDQAETVIGAAQAHVEGRVEKERELLIQATGSERSPDAPTITPSLTDRSSTQVSQLLLAQLHEIVANDASAQEVRRQIESGYQPELEQLPNYQSYKNLLDRIRRGLADAGDAPAQRVIAGLLTKASADELALRELSEALGGQIVTTPMTILTYALSMRVIQVLWGVSEEMQRGSRVLAAEGRVKSVPRDGELLPFADAAEILRLLADTGYERVIVPDAVAPSLLEKGEVELLLLGAQKVFLDDSGRPTHFVATAGTNALLRAAKAGGAKVIIVAERSKAVTGEKPDAKPRKRVASVRLPATSSGKPVEHAPLLTISAELCILDPGDDRAVADPSVIQWVDADGSHSQG